MPAPPPPSEPPVRRSALWRAPLALVCGVVLCLIAYTALHPVRLLSQASYVGKAPKSLQGGDDVRPSSFDSCPCRGDRQPAVDNSTRIWFPNSAPLPDGRRRVRLDFPEPSYDDDSNQTAASKPLAGNLKLLSDDAPDQDVQVIEETPREMRSLVGVTPDHRVVGASVAPIAAASATTAGTAEAPAEVALFQFGIIENRSPVVRSKVRAPAVGAVREMELSPAGDRILWVIQAAHRPHPAVAWLANHVPALGKFATTRQAITVWTTDLRGLMPIRIGEEVAQGALASGQKPTPLPAHFSYLADRRQIRFVYGNSFFAVRDPQS